MSSDITGHHMMAPHDDHMWQLSIPSSLFSADLVTAWPVRGQAAHCVCALCAPRRAANDLPLCVQLSELSSAAKVARWFELLQTPGAPLSRPESGFVSGAQSGDLGGSAGEANEGDADTADVTDAMAGMDSVSAALSRLPARKRNKLFKLKLGRNVTF